MTSKLSLLIAAACICASLSCSKNTKTTGNCFPDAATMQVLTNKNATVKQLNEKFYLVPENTIDEILNPCNLPENYARNNMNVVISGEVKETAQDPLKPCCTDDFVITSITPK